MTGKLHEQVELFTANNYTYILYIYYIYTYYIIYIYIYWSHCLPNLYSFSTKFFPSAGQFALIRFSSLSCHSIFPYFSRSLGTKLCMDLLDQNYSSRDAFKILWSSWGWGGLREWLKSFYLWLFVHNFPSQYV